MSHHLIRKQEELEKNIRKMYNIYLSTRVFAKEVDVTIYPRIYKSYTRRIKIGKIFDIDVPSVIVTSTPKGGHKNVNLFK